jgi:Ran GTPase-activating protein (RanGAP) involved in mRNA processing and transport
MGALEGALLSLHELRLLDLNGNRLTARGATNLAEGLRLCSTLTTLALNFNFLGAEGAQSMTPVFSAQHALTDLDLSFNDMGPAGVRALVQGLAPEEEGDRIQLALVHLDLSKNTLGARGAAELFPLLRRCATTVETVSLRCNGLGQQYAAMVNCQVPRATVHVLEEY